MLIAVADNELAGDGEYLVGHVDHTRLLHGVACEGVQCPVSSVQCPVSSVQCPVSSVQCPVSSVHHRCVTATQNRPAGYSHVLKTGAHQQLLPQVQVQVGSWDNAAHARLTYCL
jgi:hypothetical protein